MGRFGLNTKKESGRQRKLESIQKKKELANLEKAKKEEILWAVGAKDTTKKDLKKEKILEKRKRKKERDQLLKEEEDSISSKKNQKLLIHSTES